MGTDRHVLTPATLAGVEHGVRLPGSESRHRVDITRIFTSGTGIFGAPTTTARVMQCWLGDDQWAERDVDGRVIPFSTAQATSCDLDVKPNFASALAT